MITKFARIYPDFLDPILHVQVKNQQHTLEIHQLPIFCLPKPPRRTRRSMKKKYSSSNLTELWKITIFYEKIHYRLQFSMANVCLPEAT